MSESDWEFPDRQKGRDRVAQFIKEALSNGSKPTAVEEETPCPVRDDKQHCDCWYDGQACCACGDPAMKTEDA